MKGDLIWKPKFTLIFVKLLITFRVVPESTRWLNTKGKEEHLRKELIQMGKMKGHKYNKNDLDKFKTARAEVINYAIYLSLLPLI